MASLWRNGSVVVNSNWSSLLISAPKVHWRVQPTAAKRSGRFNQMHGALRALHDARVSEQCLHENCLQMLEKKQWPPNNYKNLNVIEICLGSDARSYFETFILHQNSFWIKNRTDTGKFSTGPINKAVLSLTSSFTRVRELWRKTF